METWTPELATHQPSPIAGRDAHTDALVAAWYTEEQAVLERYVRSLVRDPDEAADVCQESFVRLLVMARATGLPDAPGAWTRRVAHNLVVSNARRRSTSERSAARLAEHDAVGSPEDSVVGREHDRHLATALASAATDDRTVMILAAQGFRSREIAERLGRSEPATRTLLCRARGRLRGRMLELEAA